MLSKGDKSARGTYGFLSDANTSSNYPALREKNLFENAGQVDVWSEPVLARYGTV